jgi:hypothetical protein
VVLDVVHVPLVYGDPWEPGLDGVVVDWLVSDVEYFLEELEEYLLPLLCGLHCVLGLDLEGQRLLDSFEEVRGRPRRLDDYVLVEARRRLDEVGHVYEHPAANRVYDVYL